MKIISIDPVYTDFNAYHIVKDTPLEVVAKVTVDDYGVRENVMVKFDLRGDREGMSWLAQHNDQGLVHRLNTNLAPKGPKSIARLALDGLDPKRPQYRHLDIYLHFDKLARKGA